MNQSDQYENYFGTKILCLCQPGVFSLISGFEDDTAGASIHFLDGGGGGKSNEKFQHFWHALRAKSEYKTLRRKIENSVCLVYIFRVY